MKRIAYYPGSFDPLTNGHLDVLDQALAIFDEVVVGIGVNAGKKPMFTFEERAALIHESLAALDTPRRGSVRVEEFDKLVIHAAGAAGARVLIRGLRDGTDLDYEMQMAGMNGTMAPEIKTVFFPASPQFRAITSTLVRQVAQMGGNVAPFVPDSVLKALQGKIGS